MSDRYLFVIVKSHELDGSVREDPDHHGPVALVQAKEAFLLRHSFEGGKHAYRETDGGLARAKHTQTRWTRVWCFSCTYPDVCNGGSGLGAESWFCPEEQWWFWHNIQLHLQRTDRSKQQETDPNPRNYSHSCLRSKHVCVSDARSSNTKAKEIDPTWWILTKCYIVGTSNLRQSIYADQTQSWSTFTLT